MTLKLCSFLTLLFVSIACINAQDYQIIFAGSGAATTVETVKVENLTQGTELTMNGGDILHLKNVVTGIDSYIEDTNPGIRFSPNPMIDYSLIKFDLPEDRQTITRVYDITGRIILQIQDYLSKGQHTYRLQGINSGLYIVKVVSDRYSVTGRLLCSGSHKGEPTIKYENAGIKDKKGYDLKGESFETVIQYNSGDRLKLTGASDIYSTVVTDIPTENKTITFDFIPCTDGEGNNYPIVKIGTQIWMGKNLRTAKYSNGTSIPFINTPNGWDILAETDKAFCYFNDDISNANIYGALYTWGAAMNGAESSNSNSGGVQGACPAGWHLPGDVEWTALVSYLGGANMAGGKLKESGSSHWSSFNPEATNESGFTALPGGFRDDWAFFAIRISGQWWSSSGSSESNAWYRSMDSESSIVSSNNTNKKWGHSVRCLKNYLP